MNTLPAKINRILASTSMSSNGARLQFGVAMALITILPLLTLVYLFHSDASAGNLPDTARWAVGLILAGVVCLGYGLLVKYPLTIIHLRQYMERTARGELPDAVELPNGESDITAIKEYFNLILVEMKKRIAVIQEQQSALIDAERQRVMVESFCTACHHLGQPATTILCCLDLLKTESLSVQGSEYLGMCISEANRMRNIMGELKGITDYRTEPYCACSEGEQDASVKIIQACGDRAAPLPNAGERLGEPFQMEAIAPSPAPSKVSVNKKKILVVDDDPRVCYLLKKTLEARQHEVIEALNGNDGLKAAVEQHPDLMILDINMPDMDGLTLLKELKEEEATCAIPVIMLTGVETEEAEEDALYNYAEDFFRKPVEARRLSSAVERIMAVYEPVLV